MQSDFETIKIVYFLDLSTVKWSEKSSMNHPRLTSSGLFFSNGFVFAIGGNSEGVCERYNVDTDNWQRIPSFRGKIEGENSLYNLTKCMLKAKR